jgi:hypothetical protein
VRLFPLSRLVVMMVVVMVVIVVVLRCVCAALLPCPNPEHLPLHRGLHHAKKSEAAGFCYVNDIVLAILELLKYVSYCVDLVLSCFDIVQPSPSVLT